MKPELVLRPLRMLLFALSLLAGVVQADESRWDGETIRIGVLNHRGTETTFSMWSPLAAYLSGEIEGQRFEIVPLDFDQVDHAVKQGDVDFVLVNPGIYVDLEVRYRVSRIATLNNRGGEGPNNVFGGVLFTRRERTDLNTIGDLKGKSFMAVDEISLGGFQMIWRKFKEAGIDPYHDLLSLSFGGTHDNVVMAVRDGEVDAATVRTNILERMAIEGAIDLAEFKIIAPETEPDFPFLISTRLYPEWPFSKVRHTSNELAQRVAVALLNMPPGHQAGVAGNYAGWTIPLDYQSVHELFEELELPPYQALRGFTLRDVFKKYFYWMVFGLFFLLLMAFMTSWVLRLNRELRKSKLYLERQHELILNSVADGISGVDLQGHSTFVNRAMEEITGWQAEELIGRNQHEILHHSRADGSDYPPQECPVYATFRDSEARFVSEDVFWKRDGTSFPVEYTSTPIKDERGRTIGSVVVFRDISQRRHAEEAVRQHQQELAHMGRLNTMGEMASGIAHELNQPLTAIATNAHACIRLLDSGQDQRAKITDVVERIGLQAERAGEIIRQLRQFVRKEEPKLSPVDLNQVVEEVVVLLNPEAKKAGVQIELELEPGLSKVFARHIQIDQVLLNLARNAIEAMADNPGAERILTIRTVSGGNNAVIVTVADTGSGLSDEIRDQMFNPFVTTKPKGMGLGLSISKGIIETHHGNLYLDSEPGKGAVFRFTLPVKREAQ